MKNIIKFLILPVICLVMLSNTSFAQFITVTDEYIQKRVDAINRINADVWLVKYEQWQIDSLKTYTFPEVEEYFDAMEERVKQLVVEEDREYQQQMAKVKEHREIVRPALHAAKTTEERYEVVRKYPHHFDAKTRALAGVKEEDIDDHR